jgi:hypothetical protein
MAEGRQQKWTKEVQEERNELVPRFAVALSLTHIKHVSLSLSLTHSPLFLARNGIFLVWWWGRFLARQCPNLVHRRQNPQRHNFLLERVDEG